MVYARAFEPEIIDTSDSFISFENAQGDIQIKDTGVRTRPSDDVTIHPDGHVTSSVEDIITRWPSTPEPTVTFQIGSDSNLTQTIKVEETGEVIKFDWLDQLKIDNPLQEADVSQAIENPKEFFKFEWLSPEDDIIDSIGIQDELMQFRYKVWF